MLIFDGHFREALELERIRGRESRYSGTQFGALWSDAGINPSIQRTKQNIKPIGFTNNHKTIVVAQVGILKGDYDYARSVRDQMDQNYKRVSPQLRLQFQGVFAQLELIDGNPEACLERIEDVIELIPKVHYSNNQVFYGVLLGILAMYSMIERTESFQSRENKISRSISRRSSSRRSSVVPSVLKMIRTKHSAVTFRDVNSDRKKKSTIGAPWLTPDEDGSLGSDIIINQSDKDVLRQKATIQEPKIQEDQLDISDSLGDSQNMFRPSIILDRVITMKMTPTISKKQALRNSTGSDNRLHSSAGAIPVLSPLNDVEKDDSLHSLTRIDRNATGVSTLSSKESKKSKTDSNGSRKDLLLASSANNLMSAPEERLGRSFTNLSRFGGPHAFRSNTKLGSNMSSLNILPILGIGSTVPADLELIHRLSLRLTNVLIPFQGHSLCEPIILLARGLLKASEGASVSNYIDAPIALRDWAMQYGDTTESDMRFMVAIVAMKSWRLGGKASELEPQRNLCEKILNELEINGCSKII